MDQIFEGSIMTNKQINIAIAEACGWKEESFGPSWYESVTKMPDYCNDLNAMHEAEKILSDQQASAYITTLCLEVQPEPKLYHATARQRAEAFLRTLGK
jgi:hypothetical protein